MSLLNNIKTVSIDGIGRLPLAEDAGKFTPSGISRKAVSGRTANDGGYTESAMQSKLELNLNAKGGFDISKDFAGVNVTVRLANGEVHLMTGAWRQDPTSLGNGTFDLVIVSNTSERIS